MTKINILIFGLILTFTHSSGQTNHFDRLSFIIGDWIGTGKGFGNDESKIESNFHLIMDGKYIEVKNESIFEPTENNPKGEYHIDKGMISYDKSRKTIVFRQFNNEGYINQYILNDSITNDSILVFESEVIENFVQGGKARWTIKKIAENKIVTTFDVSFPNKEYTCFGTNYLTKTTTSMSEVKPKVTGIGGIFFFSENPNETKNWYSENLGLEINEWGSSFEFRNANRPDEINYLQWSPFKKGSDYFAPSKKEFMINYRVQNIEGLVNKLKENGVTIVDEIESFEYGKFVHIMDPEGNKIELWEPIDSVFTKMGGKTTK
ncbi:MAG: hypothetical protein RBR97_17915 [Bacteroidales bacterium]|jgi:predicted enzyme related to lactoylglutathione lyase|nr:hypothetical protein [Bacteroidales bacterium]